jgi:hypothetical protein
MNYRQIRPSAVVSQYVEFYWILEDTSPAFSIQRIVPDGRAAIILNVGNPFESQTNGIWHPQPECFLIGQITGPLLLRASGAAGMLGIQFRPHGVTGLFKLPMSELTDSAVALDDLSRKLFRQLERVRDFSSPEQAAAALDSILQGIAASVRRDRVGQHRECGRVGGVEYPSAPAALQECRRHLTQAFQPHAKISASFWCHGKFRPRLGECSGSFRLLRSGALDSGLSRLHRTNSDRAA